jgi:NADH:ubiquinone reductase (H+-translocating)
VPAQLVTRGYHLAALPSLRTRAKAGAEWLIHAGLGEDFVRVGLLDTAPTGLGERVGYLSADQARTIAASLPPT